MRIASPRSILLPLWWRLLRSFQISLLLRGLHRCLVYASLLSGRFTQSPMGTPTLNQLSYEKHPFFEGLLPLSDNIKPFCNESCEGDIFETCTCRAPIPKDYIGKVLESSFGSPGIGYHPNFKAQSPRWQRL